MKFYVGKMRYKRAAIWPSTPENVDCFLLSKDNWNDYGTNSLFLLTMKNAIGEEREIGFLKILKREEPDTNLPETFEELSREYISLGQSLEFYSDLLNACGSSLAVSVLEALNDISWAPDLSIPYETNSAFRNSLLRGAATDDARRYGRSIINGESVPETFSFDYAGEIPGADGATEISAQFDPIDQIPGRIVGIIGKNAVGKTQYLAQLARDLAHTRRTSKQAFDQLVARFGGSRPSYNRILAISYSAFDRFPRPKEKNINYVYCGIRDRDGRASKSHLLKTFRKNLARVKDLNRDGEWMEILLEILDGEESQLREVLQNEIQSAGADALDEELSILSSGQAILTNFITSILAWIETKSLVLFDEPEMHLHPNAVASLIKVFSGVLKQFDSFALLATHSPLVIQEIPSSRVIVFQREGNTTEASRLPSETFGENLSDLTRHIFETHEISPHYKSVLEKISRKHLYETALGLFPTGLSMNARSYLLSCYSNNE